MCKLLNGKSLLFAALLLSAISMSCSHDPQDDNSKQSGNNVHEWEDSTLSGDAVMGMKMLFNVGDSLQVIRKPSTRLSTTFNGQSYTLSGDERITIAMKRGSEAEVIKIYKVKDAATGALEYEKDADGNKTEPFYWKSTTETVKLRAWSYGTSEAYTSDPLTTPFTLNTTQTELTAGKDNYRELLYDKQRDYPYAANITLNLYHQLARITVELTNSATSDLSIATNGVTIGGGVLPTSAQFVAPTGDSNVGSWDDLQTNSGTVTARADVANQKYSAVVFPKTYSAGTKIVGVTTTAESPWNSYAYTLPGGEELEAGKQYSYKVNVRDLVLVSSLTVSDIAAVTYNGSAQTPEPTVTDPVSGKVLTKGTHYTLSYTNNTNAGTATCTVTGKGIYSGTQNKNFTINKKAATISFANATLTKTYEDADFTVTVNNTGDGTVTYASANTTDATVGSGNGTVSIKNANTTGFNITATVVDGTNYTYATKTASYKLTINRKALDSSRLYFASTAITRSYIWELATGTNALTKPTACIVTYTSSDANVATVNSSTGALTPGGTLAINTTITATATGNYSGTATYTIKATSNYRDFGYTRTDQSVTLPKGTFKMECWGAQGGGTDSYPGAKGAYTKGNLTLTANTSTLHVFVGQCGGDYTSRSAPAGNSGATYIGGTPIFNNGFPDTMATLQQWVCAGGGATDIRTLGGEWNNSSGLSSRIMVAAGGGGTMMYYAQNTGGEAGAYTGYDGKITGPITGPDGRIATGGTQTQGGRHGGGSNASDYSDYLTGNEYAAFGQTQVNKGCGAGGGGGWYCGGNGAHGGGTTGSGAGGSSYVSGHSGCAANATYRFNTGTTEMIDGKGYSWSNTTTSTLTVIPAHPGYAAGVGHTGDGYARITWVSN